MAAETLIGKDRHCMNFNRAFRAGKIGPKTANDWSFVDAIATRTHSRKEGERCRIL